ncbi:MAG: mannose-6-phosphate isomerase [Clostridia bacterium]
MVNLKKLISEPIFFERNRVFRVYLGGLSYGDIFDTDEKSDTMFPEEWVASKVRAINPKYFGARDGVSVIKGTNIYFDDLLSKYSDKLLGGRKYDCLVKFLDSAIRLPLQVHPTPEFSKKYFNISYGKTEAWLVIATRPNAKIFFGFNDKISVAKLSELEEKSLVEKDIMSSVLASVDAKVGDIYLIRAGLVHAIGAGCTIIEIQEPTDFTIQPENWCGNYKISEEEKYIGLSKHTALSCFNFDLYGQKAVSSAKITPKLEIDTLSYKKENLITYDDTPCFSLNRHTLSKGSLVMNYAPSVWITLSGEAIISYGDYKKQVKKGDYWFLPYSAENKFSVSSDDCVLVECLPSLQI